jgi:hypothetical protein
MSAIVSALFALFPGFILTYFLDSKERSIAAQICDAIVLSLLIESAVAWLPGGTIMPFGLWLMISLGLSAVGFALFAHRIISRRVVLLPGSRQMLVLRAVALGAIAFYGVILLVRPNIDWDAITYYLPVSLDFTLSGHFGTYLSNAVTTANGAPNVQPPIMPVLYALAIGVAQIFHSTADFAIRLFALVFIAGTWLSVRRLASAFLPPVLAESAGLLYLLLPATVSAASAVPLLLDLGFTFLCTALIAEVVHLSDLDTKSWIRIGCIASAIVLFKVNGLPFVALTCASVVLTRLPAFLSRILAAGMVIGMVLLTAHFHFFDKVATPSLAISIGVVAALMIYCAGPHGKAWSGSRSATIGAIAALVPGALHLVTMTLIVGSPAAYYIPQLAKVSTAHWHEALALLNSAQLYVSSTQPGLPEHFGPGLLFWWGFSPLLALFGLAAIVLSGRNRESIAQLAMVCLLFAAAFLTIFRLDDFRHLLPVTPLIPVLALYAVYRLNSEERWARWVTLLAVAAVPFFWIGQQSFFTVPLGMLTALHWDQWNALSFTAFVNIALYVAAFVLIGISAPNSRSLTAAAAVAAGLALFCMIGLQRLDLAIVLLVLSVLLVVQRERNLRYATVVVLVTLAVFFEPVLITAASPGFSAQASQVSAAEDGGYLNVLWPALNNWNARLLLTFKSYGITWFSMGHARRIELTDASDLGRIEPVLRQKDPRTIIQTLGIDGTLLPSPNGSQWSSFESLRKNGQLRGLTSLSDPLLTLGVVSDNWTYRSLFPITQPETLSAKLELVSARGKIGISDQPLLPSRGWTQMQLSSPALGSSHTQATIYASIFAADTPESDRLVRIPGPFGKIDLQMLFRQLRAKNDDLIDLRAVVFSSDATPVASFRTEGLEIQRAARGFTLLRGAPMILHAEDGLVDSISALDAHGHSLRYFPAPAAGDFEPGAMRLSFDLRSDPLCPAGTPIELGIVGNLIDGPQSITLIRTLRGNSGGRVSLLLPLSLPKPTHGTETFVLKTITARGITPACALSETIVPEAFSVTTNSTGTSTLDVTPAVPFHVQSIRVGGSINLARDAH